MTDLKEEYYFTFVPEWERDNTTIDWKTYHSLLNVILTYSALDARMSQFLSPWELFPSAFNLLVILHRTGGEGMHLSKISELLAVSRANVTGLVDVLSRKNLVKRVSSTTDRRVRLAVLTPDGSKMIQEILPKYYEFNRGLTDDISEKDAQTLIEVLTKFRKSACNDGACKENGDK